MDIIESFQSQVKRFEDNAKTSALEAIVLSKDRRPEKEIEARMNYARSEEWKEALRWLKSSIENGEIVFKKKRE